VRTLAALAGVLATLLPATPAHAAVVTTTYFVPTVGGATIRVEVTRNTNFDPQPVVLTYSPYNNLNGATPSTGSAGSYNSKGIARAVADVLGTRGSTGCWDYGGLKEQQSGVDVVKFLAGKTPDVDGNLITWSNGNIGMTGTSYDGTTANMVAATGIPELKGIIPIAAISHWYGYAYYDGARYALNSRVLTDEGLDTPLLFDYGFNRTFPEDDPGMIQHRVGQADCEQESLDHTQHGYSRSPDYTSFWRERDYRKDADKFRAAVMVVHGWQDYNVKQDEGVSLYEALPVDDPLTEDVIEGVPFKLLWLTQSSHAGGSGPGYQAMVDSFWAQTLKGQDKGLDELETPVKSLGSTSSGPGVWQDEVSWPPAGTKDVPLYLGRTFDMPPAAIGETGVLKPTPQNSGGGWVHANPGTVSEEATLRDPTNRGTTANGMPVRGHGYVSLYQESAPLAQDVRIAGRAVLDAYVNVPVPGQHLTPILVEVLSNGNLNLVERGFLNLDYRDGLDVAKPTTGWLHGQVNFLPQDYTFKAGSRIGLILQGSNTVWALPGNPGQISYAMGPQSGVTTTGTSLRLPIVGAPADPAALFTP
jgi:X-Pro dipeptidyl-peptidase